MKCLLKNKNTNLIRSNLLAIYLINREKMSDRMKQGKKENDGKGII